VASCSFAKASQDSTLSSGDGEVALQGLLDAAASAAGMEALEDGSFTTDMSTR
jgi:hypothetical protein